MFPIDAIFGVPKAGHWTSHGFWHPGDHRTCRACHPIKNRAR